MKIAIGAISSLLIPGLGQLFQGKIVWAVGWFFAAFVFGPIVHLASAVHAAWLAL